MNQRLVPFEISRPATRNNYKLAAPSKSKFCYFKKIIIMASDSAHWFFSKMKNGITPTLEIIQILGKVSGSTRVYLLVLYELYS